MGLSADDIVNYPLKQAVRGYSVPQVDELLDQVADTVERLTAELEDVRDRLRRSEARLDAASETESTLKRTLVTAQRAAEQSLGEARAQAEGIVEEARREAALLLEQAQLEAESLRVEAVQAARAEEAEIRRRRHALEGHIEALRIFEREYRSRLRGHLEEQLRLLEEAQHRPGEEVPSLDDAAPLRVRVRGVHDDDGPEGRDGRMDDAGAVGSRAPEAEDDEVRTERRRSVP